jgi:hypothetical protein
MTSPVTDRSTRGEGKDSPPRTFGLRDSHSDEAIRHVGLTNPLHGRASVAASAEVPSREHLRVLGMHPFPGARSRCDAPGRTAVIGMQVREQDAANVCQLRPDPSQRAPQIAHAWFSSPASVDEQNPVGRQQRVHIDVADAVPRKDHLERPQAWTQFPSHQGTRMRPLRGTQRRPLAEFQEPGWPREVKNLAKARQHPQGHRRCGDREDKGGRGKAPEVQGQRHHRRRPEPKDSNRISRTRPVTPVASPSRRCRSTTTRRPA